MFFLSHKTISKCLKILEEECFAKLYTTFFYFRKVEQILNLNINIKAIVLSEVHYYYFTSPVHHTLAGCSFRNGVLYMYIYVLSMFFEKFRSIIYNTFNKPSPLSAYKGRIGKLCFALMLHDNKIIAWCLGVYLIV